MPYLDLDDDDGLIHLWQLFLAAHPAYRESNDAMREVGNAPGEYFASIMASATPSCILYDTKTPRGQKDQEVQMA